MGIAGERISIWVFGRSATGVVLRRADGGRPRCFLDLAPPDAGADEHGRLVVQASVDAFEGRLPDEESDRLAAHEDASIRAALCAHADDRTLLALLLDDSPEVRRAALAAEQHIERRIIAALAAPGEQLATLAEGERNHRVMAAMALNPELPERLARRLAAGQCGAPAAPIVLRALSRPSTVLLGHLNTYLEHVKQARLLGVAPCG